MVAKQCRLTRSVHLMSELLEKKKRRKKIDVSLDTKNVDVTLKREEDGDIEITLDTVAGFNTCGT